MTKDTSSKLQSLMQAIVEEASRNEAFGRRLEEILNGNETVSPKSERPKKDKGTRAANRRDPAVLDPIAMCEEDEKALESRLNELTDKELKDIIADYGMDPSKLAMKWKDRTRVINLILETARRRANKGDAFRNQSE